MSSNHDFAETGAILQLDDYLRQRLSPRPGDIYYLHLVDLRRSLAEFETSEPIMILDYGAGGSPYRSLFPNATYHRADFIEGAGLDFRTDAEGRLPSVGSGIYDLVLSTQVLEHVETPNVYLQEALRVLKPGGRLLLTTHGVFPDHGCPYDFWRWTTDGLKLELTRAGFAVEKQYRLTAGPRAVLYWMGRLASVKVTPEARLPRLMAKVLRKTYRGNRARIDRMFDRWFGAYAVREGHCEPAIDFSVGLLAAGRKPASTASDP